MVAVPWHTVVTLNKALCQAQKVEALTRPETFDSAAQLWDQAAAKVLTMLEAFEICRRAHELGPFVFNNGNTFAALGCTLVEEHLQGLPPVEAQILRTTIGHYICGLIGRRELLQVARHFDPILDARAVSAAHPEPAPTPEPTPTPAPAPAPNSAPAPAGVSLGLPRQQGA